MFSKSIIFIVMFFTALGFRPELPKMITHRKISHVFYIIYIGLAIVLSCYWVKTKKWLSSSLFKMEVINGMAHYFCALFTYWTFIIETFIQREHQGHFWMLLQNADQHFIQTSTGILYTYPYIAKLVEYYVFYICVLLYFLYLQQTHISDIFFVYNILYFMTLSQIFYCLFYLETLLFKLKNIKNEVKQLCTLLGENHYERPKINSTLESFVRLREHYHLLNEMNDTIQSNFGCSISAIIPYGFLVLLCQINWSYENASGVREAIGSLYLL